MAEYDVKSGSSYGVTLDGVDLLPSAGEIIDTAKFDGVLVTITGSIISGETVLPGDGARLAIQHSDSDDPATFTDVPSNELNGSLPGPDVLISAGSVSRAFAGYIGKKRYLRAYFYDSVNGDMLWTGGITIILLKGEHTP